MLTDALGARAVLATGSLVGAMALAWLANTRSALASVAGLLLLANAAVCLLTAASVLLPAAFGGTSPLAALSFGYALFGLAALATTRVLDHVTLALESARTVNIVALLAVLPAVLATLTEVEAFPAIAANGASVGVTQRPDFWLLALALLIYFAVEQGMESWMGRHLVEIGHPEQRVAWLMVGFWVAVLVGRFAVGLACDRGWPSPSGVPWFVLGVALAGSIFLGNLAGARSVRSATNALLLVGVLLGSIFPLLVGLLFERFPKAQWGTAFGGALAAGWLGKLAVEARSKSHAQEGTARRSLWGLVVGLLLVMLVMLVLGIGRTLRQG
jgi:fucose permease